ncbi:hypothetical protein SERLADRAFT_459530 [Serpula lacrymans var. lacrymans S7.9]|uniref:Uncharacterized protein n=1 Tax=Serpula lacrymans var. lacrymans (strain S7.9) TaxID=578457 RepID=F8NKI1_SERL9|nr:uncharacterized protein SERLADRAFT_459530 [Serpula lacrymans var. lacrymans S7.9]EGO28758.1 hypothetical protein SERLADRAFT_459530 [Serpula lacrymans var. lacrymans S7.9]
MEADIDTDGDGFDEEDSSGIYEEYTTCDNDEDRAEESLKPSGSSQALVRCGPTGPRGRLPLAPSPIDSILKDESVLEGEKVVREWKRLTNETHKTEREP